MEEHEIRWRLEIAPLLESLPVAEVAVLARRAVPRWLEQGEPVLVQGTPPSSLAFVVDGCVAVGAVSPEGRQAILALRGPGEIVGENGLFQPRCRPGSFEAWGDPGGSEEPCPPFLPGAWARSPGRVLFLGLESVQPLVWRYASFARALAELAQERWEETAERLADLLLGGVSARVRSVLARLAQASGVAHADGTLISLPVTQGDIAAMIGTSRESVNRSLAGLAASGEVRVADRRHLVIRRPMGREASA